MGSSTEGRPIAEVVSTAVEATGLCAQPWYDFFKTADIPLQELDRRMFDADGAILIATPDDSLVLRGDTKIQMRDNVLLEYGLFAGHLGRHRCILLMPDRPEFRVPTDFIGVAGFTLYSEHSLSSAVIQVQERLLGLLSSNAVHGTSSKESCKRILLFIAWIRSEYAQALLPSPHSEVQSIIAYKIDAIRAFLQEDIAALSLEDDVDELSRLIHDCAQACPKISVSDLSTSSAKERIVEFLRSPRQHYLCGDFHQSKRAADEIKSLLGNQAADLYQYAKTRPLCPACYDSDGCIPSDIIGSFAPIYGMSCFREDRHGNRVNSGNCLNGGWYLGALDIALLASRELSHINELVDSVDRWARTHIPLVIEQLSRVEKAVHIQVFGHL